MSAQDVQPLHWHYTDLDDNNFQLHGRSLFIVLLVVFAVLLFIILLCLYLRWACCYPGRWGLGLNETGMNSSSSSGLSHQLGPLGLDASNINSLPVLLYRQAVDASRGSRGEESMCSICLSTFLKDEKVKMLPRCKHTFHPECVDDWLRVQSSCPLCRAGVGELLRMEDAGDGAMV